VSESASRRHWHTGGYPYLLHRVSGSVESFRAHIAVRWRRPRDQRVQLLVADVVRTNFSDCRTSVLQVTGSLDRHRRPDHFRDPVLAVSATFVIDAASSRRGQRHPLRRALDQHRPVLLHWFVESEAALPVRLPHSCRSGCLAMSIPASIINQENCKSWNVPSLARKVNEVRTS
jgi:hypothetical protein